MSSVRSQNWTPEEGESFYGTLGYSIVRMWAGALPGLWLAATLQVDILVYKY